MLPHAQPTALLGWHLILQVLGISGHRLHFHLLAFSLDCDHQERFIDTSKKYKNCGHPLVDWSVRIRLES